MTTALTERRELAHRTSDGVDVTLFWSQPSHRVTIAVLDSDSDVALEFEVDGADALDAFNHPYAYAATAGASASLRVGCASRRGSNPRSKPPAAS